jgi:hydroxyethylthiazole kinase-like uncharacterized protein yjeF
MAKKYANEQRIGKNALMPLEVLTPEEMGRADRFAIDHGVPGYELMLAAGRAVADAAIEIGGHRILVLAGPGNNGGDGLVAARFLMEAGYDVRVALLGHPGKLQGDAATAYGDFKGPVETLDSADAGEFDLDADLVVDALFGAGLTRGITGDLGRLVERVNGQGAAVLAVDLPSGVDGATGQIAGSAVEADRTVTFYRLKPGHLLYPGRGHCGAVGLAQIGIGEEACEAIGVRCFLNTERLWRDVIPRLGGQTHKYTRGHALIVSGTWARTGASRLAAGAALRVGSGLVTVAADTEAARIHAAHLTAVMIRECNAATELAAILADKRFTAAAIGPAAGLDEPVKEKVMACLQSGAAFVLDADALMLFADNPDPLFAAVSSREAPVVMTPHAGEFARLFPDVDTGGKIERARQAAMRSGAVILYKGPDTIVADPDGRVSVSASAPPWLATAGSGDVLTGMVAGLLAQKMPAFDAASAAVWIHGEAAASFGPGLTADDLPGQLPEIVRKVYIYD